MTVHPAPRTPPSFARRVLVMMLCAVMLFFALLYAFIAFREWFSQSNDFDRSLTTVAKSVVQALETVDSNEGARAAIMMLRMSLSAISELDGSDTPLHLLVARRDGTLRLEPALPDPSAAAAAAPDGAGTERGAVSPAVAEARRATAQAVQGVDVLLLPDGLSKPVVQGLTLHLYTASSERWRVAVADNASARGRWFLWILFKELLGYLGLSLVIIVLPAWWALRRARDPLRRLSNAVAARAPNDTRPLALLPSHRELQPLHSALNRLFEKLAHGVAREKAFVHDAAHELRTPLAVIATQAHVLIHAEGDARPEAAKRLQSAVTRASHLSTQLLELAQSDTLEARPRQTLDAMAIVRDVMASLADRAQAQRSELSLHGPDTLMVATDARALHSIVENLLDNALRYGRDGVTVEMHVGLEAQAWLIRVADDGPGLPPAQREQAFERFWRADTGRAPGAGLGLAIVQEAARGLGGSVRMEVGLNKRGCGVVVVMPRGV